MICPIDAGAVRFRNQELDGTLLNLARSIDPTTLEQDPGDGEWTLAQNLGHIGEFPGFFARQLDGYLDGADVPVGRLLDNEFRLGGVASGAGRPLGELIATMESNFALLQLSLDRLVDADLERIAHNGKYGDETVLEFLNRYVLDHKAEHVVQLRTTIARVSSLG